jgi:MerR family transcriptional regulator, light-induced transcriptional regulator
VYTVKHVARMTGIPADTVRMWERRYGVVTPTRSEGGYRLYDEASVRRLAAMHALVTAGWSPRLAAEQVRTGAGAVPLQSETAPHPTDALDSGGLPSLVPLARDLDPQRLESMLSEVFASAPFEDLVDDWLLPALGELGAAWQSGSVSVGGEHFVSAALQRHVAGVLAAARPVAEAPRVVAGLARESRHELGILAFAALLGRAGVDVLYVGADLPTESWVDLLGSSGAKAVVLSVPTAEDVPGVRDVVAAVAGSRPTVDIHVGGRHQDVIGSPARPLGHLMVPAARGLVASLG